LHARERESKGEEKVQDRGDAKLETKISARSHSDPCNSLLQTFLIQADKIMMTTQLYIPIQKIQPLGIRLRGDVWYRETL